MKQAQHFSGFLHRLSVQGRHDAKMVVRYAKNRTSSKSAVCHVIRSAAHKNRLTNDEADRLLSMADQLFREYLAGGCLIDARDPNDWETVGEGAIKRKNHLEQTRDDEVVS
jgi:hypothetical protein